jgi:hypothetical protein
MTGAGWKNAVLLNPSLASQRLQDRGMRENPLANPGSISGFPLNKPLYPL